MHITASLNYWDLIISEGILNLSWMTLGLSKTKDGLIINKEVQKSLDMESSGIGPLRALDESWD